MDRAARAAYEMVRERIGGRHPVRFWNHIPLINERTADGRDHYMVFNAGRFAAFEAWYGGREAFDRQVATASGVGHWGTELVVHCLAAERPGEAVRNLRQVQPHRYSRRFGPVPPCFARAMRVEMERRPVLLVGGTASIRGEETLCVRDLRGQVRETFTNLAAVVDGGVGDWRSLERYRELRVYLPRAEDRRAVEEAVRGAFVGVGSVEYVPAGLCREELLVEIEGVAEVGDGARVEDRE